MVPPPSQNCAPGPVFMSISRAQSQGTCAIPARLSCSQSPSTDVLQVLFRFFSPFRLMKDVSRGSFEERMAAYRHNRSMRSHLPACMLRWAASCSIAILLTAYFDTLGG